MTTTLIKRPPTLKAFKDWLDCYLGDLVRETGYDYFDLQEMFMDQLLDNDNVDEPLLSDEGFTKFVDTFTGITLEKDW